MIPGYLLRPLPMPRTLLGRLGCWLIQLPIKLYVWLILSPRKGDVGGLSPDEVMRVYDREARSYNAKHHLTTRGQDLFWRREAGWCVLNVVRNAHKFRCRVVDLCTGTGMTVREIAHILDLHEERAAIVGIDLNEAMLQVARNNIPSYPDQTRSIISFVKGDATNIDQPASSTDIVTQMFGIGGIPDPDAVFQSVLRILKDNGRYYLVDMHQPIPELPGEFPLGLRWMRAPTMEAAVYSQTTIPLALARLWGWRDTTLDFYRVQLAVQKNLDTNEWHGFEVEWFKPEPERWWFGLPVMPTARILLRKTKLTEEESSARKAKLANLVSYTARI